MTQMENRFVQAPPPPVQPGYGYGDGPGWGHRGNKHYRKQGRCGHRGEQASTASRVSAGCSSPARPSGRTPPPAARHRDDARRPARRRLWRTDPAPATGRRGQRGSIRVAICVKERRPVFVGDQARGPEAGWTGEVPRRVAASEVVDVEQQPGRDRRPVGRAGPGGSHRAPASGDAPASRPATPFGQGRRRAANGVIRGCPQRVQGAAHPLWPAVRRHSRGQILAVQPGQQSARPRPMARIRVAAQRFPRTASACATCLRPVRAPSRAVSAEPATRLPHAVGSPTSVGRFPPGAACRPRRRRRRSLHRSGSAPLDRISDAAAAAG